VEFGALLEVTLHNMAVCHLVQVFAPPAQQQAPPFTFEFVAHHNRFGLFLFALTRVNTSNAITKVKVEEYCVEGLDSIPPLRYPATGRLVAHSGHQRHTTSRRSVACDIQPNVESQQQLLRRGARKRRLTCPSSSSRASRSSSPVSAKVDSTTTQIHSLFSSLPLLYALHREIH